VAYRIAEPARVPAIPVDHDGAEYVVSTRGDSDDWRKRPEPADRPTFRLEPET
jgi:hypothetical protein